MEKESFNDYISRIQKMIRTGNPKYMPYISREYMKYIKINPQVSNLIETILYKEVNLKPKNPYSIFLDDDGTVNLEAISDISKITNVAAFINQVEDLSEFEVDFKDMTSEELIVEGEKIVEELEKELEKENLTQQEIHMISEKADTTLKKMGLFATIGATFMSIFSRIKDKLKQKEDNILETKKNNTKKYEDQKLEEIFPKVKVDEQKAIREMKNLKETKNLSRQNGTYGDGDPDGDDLDL